MIKDAPPARPPADRHREQFHRELVEGRLEYDEGQPDTLFNQPTSTMPSLFKPEPEGCMEAIRVRTTVVILCSVLACVMAVGPLRASQGPRDGGSRNQSAVLKYLAPAIASEGKGALLLYRTECDMRASARWDPAPFPEVREQPPLRGARGLAAVREIFRGDAGVVVTTSPSGMIRISIGDVPGGILRARIGYLALGKLGPYIPSWTIYRIEKSADVKAAMRRLHARPAPFSPGLVSLRGGQGAPHLPSALRNITVEKALDLTARTFKGIVIYGACVRPNGQQMFRLDFAYIATSQGERSSTSLRGRR